MSDPLALQLRIRREAEEAQAALSDMKVDAVSRTSTVASAARQRADVGERDCRAGQEPGGGQGHAHQGSLLRGRRQWLQADRRTLAPQESPHPVRGSGKVSSKSNALRVSTIADRLFSAHHVAAALPRSLGSDRKGFGW